MHIGYRDESVMVEVATLVVAGQKWETAPTGASVFLHPSSSVVSERHCTYMNERRHGT